VPKIKMEEDCWVINGQIITPESVGDISDIIGENESVLRAHAPGHKGDRYKNKEKKTCLKVVHETLDELIYFLKKQEKYTR